MEVNRLIWRNVLFPVQQRHGVAWRGRGTSWAEIAERVPHRVVGRCVNDFVLLPRRAWYSHDDVRHASRWCRANGIVPMADWLWRIQEENRSFWRDVHNAGRWVFHEGRWR